MLSSCQKTILKVKILIILTIFKILKIHCNNLWFDFLNKDTIVYLEIHSLKLVLYRNCIYKANQLTTDCFIYDTFFLECISG